MVQRTAFGADPEELEPLPLPFLGRPCVEGPVGRDLGALRAEPGPEPADVAHEAVACSRI